MFALLVLFIIPMVVLLFRKLIPEWSLAPYLAVFLLCTLVMQSMALKNAPTLPALPAHLLRRNKLISVGGFVFTLGIVASVLLRESNADGVGMIFNLIGSLTLLVCYIIGFGQAPKPASSDKDSGLLK